jgi:UDP-glucose 4-epimerase
VSTVLVTNAGSPPGVELCYALAAHTAVLACGSEPETAMEPLFRGIAVRWVRADLSHSRARRGLLFGAALDARVQAVVHASPRDTRRPHDAADTVRELLHLCERHPTIQRFVYRSTGEVYRVGPGDPALIDEEHPVESDPSAPGWLRDRVEADQAACARIGTSRLRVTVLRCAELFAPGADGQLQRWLRSDPCFRPLGYDPMVNLITREDLVRAIGLAVRAHESGVFNIPGADLLPLSELAARSGRRCLPLPGWLVPASYRLRALAGPGFDYRTSERRFHFGGVLCGRSALAALGYQPRAGLFGPVEPVAAPSRVRTVSLNGPPPNPRERGGSVLEAKA